MRGGVFDALDGEAEGGEAAEFAEALIEALKGAGWVVLGADEAEFDAGGANAGLGVGDAEDDDFVAAPFELSGERGQGVDVSGAGETECSKPCHGSRSCCEFGPVESTSEKSRPDGSDG